MYPNYQDTQVFCANGESIHLPKLIVGLVFPELENCQTFNLFAHNSIILPDYTLAEVKNIFFELLLKDDFIVDEEAVQLHDLHVQSVVDITKNLQDQPDDKFYDDLLNDQLPDLLLKETKTDESAAERSKKRSYKGEIYPGEYRYKCNYCDKRFKQVGHVNHHERKHTGSKKYECDLCKKRFNQKCHLIDHKRLHTGEKPYKCEDCGKCFTFSSGLKSHIRIHTGERQFSCSFCEKKFNQRTNLKTHERLHTGDLKFICSSCGKCFNTKSNLTRHLCKPVAGGEEALTTSCSGGGGGSANTAAAAAAATHHELEPNYANMWQPEIILDKLCDDRGSEAIAPPSASSLLH